MLISVQISGAVAGSGLGPASAGPPRVVATPAQAEVFDRLAALGEPATAADLAAASGQHVNTVREHLDALTRVGLVSRSRSAPQGRGRPAHRYAAVRHSADTAAYAALVDALSSHLAATCEQPGSVAVDLGRRVAQGLPDPALPGTSSAGRRALGVVVESMRALGFAARVDSSGTRARLHTCPVVDVAVRQTQVVCGIHRGVVEALAGRAGAPGGIILTPFAEPGACLLHLRPPTTTPA